MLSYEAHVHVCSIGVSLVKMFILYKYLLPVLLGTVSCYMHTSEVKFHFSNPDLSVPLLHYYEKEEKENLNKQESTLTYIGSPYHHHGNQANTGKCRIR